MDIAIIGMGGMGKTHINNIRMIADARITDICNLTPDEEFLAQNKDISFYEDYRIMLEKSTAEIVIVSTPTFLHGEQVRAVLESKRHCICEKPLCLSADEASELFVLAHDQSVQLFVAHVLLFWEEYTLLSRFVREMTYGHVMDIKLVRLTERPAWSSGGWMFDRYKSGLLPFDLHIHDLYFIISMFGKPKIGYLQHGGNKAVDYDEYLRVCYEFPNLTICAEASWYNAPYPFTQGYRVYFEDALVTFNGEEVLIYKQGCLPEKFFFEKREKILETSINVSRTSAYMLEIEHFIDCARNNIPSQIVTRDQVVWTSEVMEDIVMRSDNFMV